LIDDAQDVVYFLPMRLLIARLSLLLAVLAIGLSQPDTEEIQ
jgi:hypothetical protein